MYNKMIFTTLLTLLGCCLVIPESAYSEQIIRTTRECPLVFSEVEPTPSDLARIERLRKVKAKKNKESLANNQSKRVYGVKLYVELPSVSDGPVLYVGDMRIGEFGYFEEGIYFKIYNKEDLERCYNKPIRFVLDKIEYNLGVSFPSEKKTIAFKQNSEQTKKFPTLKEFLGGTASSEGDVDEK